MDATGAHLRPQPFEPRSTDPSSESEDSMAADVDHHETTSDSERAAPAVPHTLTGIAGEDNIALRWEQDGEVDFWTVYIDPLDGSPSSVYRTTRPKFEITDLPQGDHEIGVMSWREGVPCPGPGVFLMVSVLGTPVGGPAQPEHVETTATAASIRATWSPSADAAEWDVRLVAADWTVHQQVDKVPMPTVSFTGLTPDTVFGVQVRARNSTGAVSRWNVAAWQRTRKSLADPHDERLASSVSV